MSYFGKPVRLWLTPAMPSGAEVTAASLPTAAFSAAGTFAAARLRERLNRVRPAEQVGLVVFREAGQAVVRARFAVRRGSRCCQPSDRGVLTGGNFCRDAVKRAPESRPPSGAGRLCRTSGSRSGSGSRPPRRPARKSLLSVCRSWRFQRRELSSRRGYASA